MMLIIIIIAYTIFDKIIDSYDYNRINKLTNNYNENIINN